MLLVGIGFEIYLFQSMGNISPKLKIVCHFTNHCLSNWLHRNYGGVSLLQKNINKLELKLEENIKFTVEFIIQIWTGLDANFILNWRASVPGSPLHPTSCQTCNSFYQFIYKFGWRVCTEFCILFNCPWVCWFSLTSTSDMEKAEMLLLAGFNFRQNSIWFVTFYSLAKVILSSS